MSDLLIEGAVADQLRELAEREQRSVEDVLKTMIEQYAKSEKPTLAQLAQTLAAADFHSGRAETASNSREILENEYGDYLARRMRGQDDA